jgi:hypothetical protein
MKTFTIKLSLIPGTFRTITHSGWTAKSVEREIINSMGIKKQQILSITI